MTAAKGRPVVVVSGPDRGGLPAWLMTALAIRRAGGRPLRMQPGKPRHNCQFDAVVIGGGSDVDPLMYGEEALSREERESRTRLRDWVMGLGLALLRILFARKRSDGYDSRRDALEQGLIEGALKDGLPLLGICRGAQLLNVTLGGSLHQEIDHFYDEGTSNLRSVLPRKTVTIDPNSRLYQILGATELRVNALHGQCVREPGVGVKITAREYSGVPQAIEVEGAALVIGVQWHPEYLPQSKRQQGLFRALVRAAAQGCDD